MNLSSRTQLFAGLALALLMAVTTGRHFAGIDLPSASWAVFLLAGVLLQPRWVFPALLFEAVLLDYLAIGWMGVSDWCVSPAYWALLPAYASLWLGGRLYARLHRDRFASLFTLAGVTLAASFVCYLFSGGGFLYFSGRFPEPSLAQLGQHIAAFYPGYLSGVAFYVGVASVLYATTRAWGSSLSRSELNA